MTHDHQPHATREEEMASAGIDAAGLLQDAEREAAQMARNLTALGIRGIIVAHHRSLADLGARDATHGTRGQAVRDDARAHYAERLELATAALAIKEAT